MPPLQVDLPDEAGWSTVSSGPLHVLVRAGGALVDRVRSAAQEGDLDEVLDALTRDGVRSAPEFVAVLVGDPARVVARGGAYAVVSGPEGDSSVRAAARGPWADEDAAAGAQRIALHTGATTHPTTAAPPAPEPAAPAAPEPPAPASPQPPAAASPQPAALAAPEPAAPAPPSAWRLPNVFGKTNRQPPSGATPPAQAAAPTPAANPPAAATSQPAAQSAPDEVEELPSYDHLFGATQHERPGYIEQHDTQGIVEPPIGHAPLESAGGFDPAAAPSPADHTLAPPADTQYPPAAAAPPAPAPPRAVEEPLQPPVKGALIDSVPWRSGGSNVPAPDPAPATRPVPAAPSVPPAPPAAAAAPSPQPPAPLPPAPAPLPQAPAPTPQAAPHTSVPAAPPAAPQPPVQRTPAPEATATPSPALPGAGDEAEATVDRRALLAGSQAVEAGPTVLAVLCPAGHTSPPHSASCRICGRDIPVQQPFPTPRPSLGVLRLQTGDIVQLDRGVLLGRSPKVNAELAAADRPHLVRVTSAQNDISRNHVEIVLEGWHVLIRDLESTNGTTVALPGQLPVRLRPNDQQVLEPGTVVTLADEVSLTYEVGA